MARGIRRGYLTTSDLEGCLHGQPSSATNCGAALYTRGAPRSHPAVLVAPSCAASQGMAPSGATPHAGGKTLHSAVKVTLAYTIGP